MSRIAPPKGSWASTIEMHTKVLKNLLVQNKFLKMFEIWYMYVPLSHGTLPKLKMVLSQGIQGL